MSLALIGVHLPSYRLDSSRFASLGFGMESLFVDLLSLVVFLLPRAFFGSHHEQILHCIWRLGQWSRFQVFVGNR